MENHVRIVGILNICLGALGVMTGLFVFTILSGAGLLSGEMEAFAITSIIGWFISMILMVVSIPALVGGIGLLKFRPWARILVIITSILDLPNIPFGTALSVYSLWVLIQDDTVALFDSSKVAAQS